MTSHAHFNAPADRSNRRRFRFTVSAGLIAATTVGGICVLQSGCLGLASNLMHAAGMDLVPAEYEGLEDQLVAVVVRTPSNRHHDDQIAGDMAIRLQQELTSKVDDFQAVRADKIHDWWDRNGWDANDFQGLGRDVGATRVLLVDIKDLSLRDGATLYRGTADVHVQVIDVATGGVPFTKTIDSFEYPRMAGQSTSETTEKRFRKLYLSILAAEIGRAFHPYDEGERVALDSKIVHNF
ncbi:MAG: hypothetical protein AAF958_20075 [Planctomycetota bacterium]